VPANVVSQHLGHASVRLTLEVYGHVLPAMDHDAAARIGEVLDDA
jgi:integrase